MSASDEVINQIIRAIVNTATAALKQEMEGGQVVSGSVSGADGAAKIVGSDGQPVVASVAQTNSVAAAHQETSESARSYNQIFLAGIHSQVKQFQVTDTLAAFMIRAVVLNPGHKFNVDKEMPRSEVDRLVKICVDLITKKDDPEMETIRCQVYFDTNFPSQDDFLQRERMSRLEQCSILLKEILEVKSKSMNVFEPLNRKIVSYVLLRSNIGVPTDVRVIREATSALESVFPVSELTTFISLTRYDKEAQLNGLTNLVTGIRLFNKHLGKGGETIELLPEICTKELHELTLLVHDQTQQTEGKIQTFKAILDYKDSVMNAELSDESAQRIRLGLVFQRQYLVYLDALREQISESEKHLLRFSMKYEDTLTELKFVCKSKTAVPVDQVYPLFISLASHWSGLFDALYLLAFRRGLVDTLMASAKAFLIQSSPLIDILCQKFRADIEPPILPEMEVIQKATTGMTSLAMVNKHAEVVHPGNTTQYYKLPVEFGGFCAWSLVNRNGLVTPGDKNVGMVRYKDKLFAFADFAKALDFFKNPDDNIESIIQHSRKQPSYVQLLHLYKFFPTVDTLEKAQSYTRQRLMGQIAVVSEVGCQVDTHVIDYNLQRNYKWNEWELRRDALMLANLKKKNTHSTQTVQSHYRRDSETQHYNAKDNITQTNKTSATSVPRTVHFLAGLRNDGSHIKRNMYLPTNVDRKQHFKIIDLTIDQDGSPVPYRESSQLPQYPVKVKKSTGN